jgi:hypothetical protein
MSRCHTVALRKGQGVNADNGKLSQPQSQSLSHGEAYCLHGPASLTGIAWTVTLSFPELFRFLLPLSKSNFWRVVPRVNGTPNLDAKHQQSKQVELWARSVEMKSTTGSK